MDDAAVGGDGCCGGGDEPPDPCWDRTGTVTNSCEPEIGNKSLNVINERQF